MLVFVGFTVVLVCLVLAITPIGKSDFPALCEELVRQARPGHFEFVSGLLDRYDIQEDAEFWRGAGGLRGILACLKDCLLHLRIVQAHFACRRISFEEARYVWMRAVLQLWFAARSIPEALICRLIPGYPHLSAVFALMSHRDSMTHMLAACITPNAPPAMRRLENIL